MISYFSVEILNLTVLKLSDVTTKSSKSITDLLMITCLSMLCACSLSSGIFWLTTLIFDTIKQIHQLKSELGVVLL